MSQVHGLAQRVGVVRKLVTFWPALVIGLIVGLVLGAFMPPARATQYRLSTAEQNLVTIINQHATFLNELKADVNLLRTDFLLLKDTFEHTSGEDADLAEGTNAATIKTTDACSYVIDGVIYEKAATDNIAITATTEQAVSTYRLYLVSIDAAGTVTVTAGTAVATDTATLPALPASSAPLGYFKIATDGSTTYTGGTTDNGAAGITDTYVDLAFMNSGSSAMTETSTAIANAAAHTARQ